MSLKGLIKQREGSSQLALWSAQPGITDQRSNLKADADNCFGLFGPPG